MKHFRPEDFVQDEKGKKREIKGKIFEIDFQKNPHHELLSEKDKEFYGLEMEISNSPMVIDFLNYLMDAAVLIPVSAYGQIYYYLKGKKKIRKNLRSYDTCHEIAAIIEGIQSGKWDPSEVLGDMARMISILPEGKGVLPKARKLILKGFSVQVIDKK